MRLLALAGALTLFPAAAGATGTVECRGADGADISVFMLVGRLPVLSVLLARVEAQGSVYTTDAGSDSDAVPMVFGQGLVDDDRLVADFTDANINEITVRLRVERAFEGKSGAEAGIVHIAGQGAYAIVCQSG
ncbi:MULTISPECIES: hypothetical protein [unclassified Roseitalea]|uniref:hypothetical protein n=1 Tax=unclassified Roseitalea TaxID=2639107 RepID=UPI00273E2A4C|nr:MULTISPECIES: hypothetical protein [unclassified Roseitalea]